MKILYLRNTESSVLKLLQMEAKSDIRFWQKAINLRNRLLSESIKHTMSEYFQALETAQKFNLKKYLS